MPCPICGRELGPQETTCRHCQPAGSQTQRATVDIDELLRTVLAQSPTEETLAETLTKEAVARHPGVGGSLADMLLRQIEGKAMARGMSRLQAAEELARGQSSVTTEMTTTTRTYHSLDEMPPELRAKAEEAMQRAKAEGKPVVIHERQLTGPTLRRVEVKPGCGSVIALVALILMAVWLFAR